MFVPIWDPTVLLWNVGDFFGWREQTQQSTLLGEAATALLVCIIIWACFSLLKRLTSLQREVALIILILCLLSLAKPIGSHFNGIAYTIQRWKYEFLRARLNLLRMGEKISRRLRAALENDVLFGRLAGWFVAAFLVTIIFIFLMIINSPEVGLSRVLYLFKDLLLIFALSAMFLGLRRRLSPKPRLSFTQHFPEYYLWNIWNLLRFFQIF